MSSIYRGMIVNCIIILSLFLFSHLVIGCSSKSESAWLKRKTSQVVKNILYHKEKRTGLCFAVSSHQNEGYLAYVPCDKVKEHLEN